MPLPLSVNILNINESYNGVVHFEEFHVTIALVSCKYIGWIMTLEHTTEGEKQSFLGVPR